MASPQKEKGYTPIAHELLKAVNRARLTRSQRAVWDCIASHSYGWGAKMAQLSRAQMVAWTGYSRGVVDRALEQLEATGMIRKANGHPTWWGVEKDYDRWVGGPSLDPPRQGPSLDPPRQGPHINKAINNSRKEKTAARNVAELTDDLMKEARHAAGVDE